MKIIKINSLKIEDVKIIKFAKFNDDRGYFTETVNIPQLSEYDELDFIKNTTFLQINEAHSKKNTLRGLHFQWSPFMGKMVRCIRGRLIDLALDIRIGSPTFGKIVGYDLKATVEQDYSEWIWVPPGFAHGTLLPEESTIEYFCTGTWSPDTEYGISPLADDIDWSICDISIFNEFTEIVSGEFNINERDKKYPSVEEWKKDDRAQNFIYGEI